MKKLYLPKSIKNESYDNYYIRDIYVHLYKIRSLINDFRRDRGFLNKYCSQNARRFRSCKQG